MDPTTEALAHDLARPDYRIQILVPAGAQCHTLFAYDLAQLSMQTLSVLPSDFTLGLSMTVQTFLHNAREDLLRFAIEQDATHVLWIDSDMRFPRDALLRLLKHKLPVVGINYATRTTPARFVALEETADFDDPETTRGRELYTGPESTGLAEVESMGFGLTLIDVAALNALPQDERWFKHEFAANGAEIEPDVGFCRLLRQHGIRLFVDQDLSLACSHIGDFPYRCIHASLEEELQREAEDD